MGSHAVQESPEDSHQFHALLLLGTSQSQYLEFNFSQINFSASCINSLTLNTKAAWWTHLLLNALPPGHRRTQGLAAGNPFSKAQTSLGEGGQRGGNGITQQRTRQTGATENPQEPSDSPSPHTSCSPSFRFEITPRLRPLCSAQPPRTPNVWCPQGTQGPVLHKQPDNRNQTKKKP